MQPIVALYLLWFVWFLTWIAVAPWTGRAVKRPGMAPEIVYRVLVVAGMLLLFKFTPMPGYDIQHMLWNTLSGEAGWLMFGVAFVAFAFCWWARINLGFLWASGKRRRRRQYIIDKGAYRVVRHPIYVGVTVAAFATAMVFGTPSSFAGAGLLMIAFVFRAVLEERFLRRELGRDSYDDYASRVPMIVPFFPTWSARQASIERTPPALSAPSLAPDAESDAEHEIPAEAPFLAAASSLTAPRSVAAAPSMVTAPSAMAASPSMAAAPAMATAASMATASAMPAASAMATVPAVDEAPAMPVTSIVTAVSSVAGSPAAAAPAVAPAPAVAAVPPPGVFPPSTDVSLFSAMPPVVEAQEPDLFPATVALMGVPAEIPEPPAVAKEFDPEEALAAAELKAAEEEAALMPAPEPQAPGEINGEAAQAARQPEQAAPAEPVAPAATPATPAAPAYPARQAPAAAEPVKRSAHASLSEAISITNR